MSYLTQQIGKTGPAGRIGSGTEYHIDTKYSRTLPFEEQVKAFDAKAKRYAKDGRNIVFSNNAVAGMVYDPSASLEDKIQLLQSASSAHSHSVSPDFHSYDYYAPVGTDRSDKSAEGAPIYLAGLPGMKVEGSQGGGYGNFGLLTDSKGNVIGKSGHGDTQLPVFGNSVLTTKGSPDNPAAVTEAVERTKNYSEMTGKELNTEYDKLRANDTDQQAAIEGMKMHKTFFNKK